MFEINRTPFVKINLEPGVYTFEILSGSGKTWLYNLLYKYEGYGEKVACYTYRDYKMQRDPTKEFQAADVIMIDRYDMYRKYLDHIIDSLTGKVILIDCKNCYSARAHDKLCRLKFSANGVEVF